MAMHATIPAIGLRYFTRALACLAKYGDELNIQATPDHLALSATNSSKSAYARVRFSSRFFERYEVTLGVLDDEDEENQSESVDGQVLVKSFLSILKHRTVEQSVERCELAITTGQVNLPQSQRTADEERDTLEGQLIVMLHCKHGVTKTHRLLLQSSLTRGAPVVPPSSPSETSRIKVGPRAVKDLLNHFARTEGQGGNKADVKLLWFFGDTQVKVKSQDSEYSKDAMQIATEIAVDAEEFDMYEIASAPISLSFHLREFNATINLANGSSLPLNITFSAPGMPMFVDVDSENQEYLFVIGTSQVSVDEDEDDGKRKRDRSESVSGRHKSARVVEVVHLPSRQGSEKAMSALSSVPPSFQLHSSQRGASAFGSGSGFPSRSVSAVPGPSNHSQSKAVQPLFMPATQTTHPPSSPPNILAHLPPASQNLIKESGLGIEKMTEDELFEMLRGDTQEILEGGDGEGWDMGAAVDAEKAWNEETDETQFMPASQAPSSGNGQKVFRPLFDE